MEIFSSNDVMCEKYSETKFSRRLDCEHLMDRITKKIFNKCCNSAILMLKRKVWSKSSKKEKKVKLKRK